jgi:hypothetical protein
MLSSDAVSIRAGCSKCDYVRSFAPELGGMFYRCPRCKEGVIAVGGDAVAALPAPPASSSAEAPSPLRQVKPPALVDPSETPSGAKPARAPLEEERRGEADDRRPRAGRVRRLLVECELCGYHVSITPELFGKTVRCPECRTDNAFTESTLEPVKDEIVGRIALAGHERKLLHLPVAPPVISPELVARERRRRILVATLILIIIVALGFVARAALRGSREPATGSK